MSDDQKVMNNGVLLAALIIIVRIVLEQFGASEAVNRIFGVAWLYFIFPVLFAWGIRMKEYASPFKMLLKDILLFAVYTRVMVAVTYMLAYIFKWSAPRFSADAGGNVGGNMNAWWGLLIVPLRNAFFWVVMATIVGMIIGSITLLLKKGRTSAPAAAA